MNSLQVIKSLNGREEYVLLPVSIYRSLHNEIEKKLRALTVVKKEEYARFSLEDYVDNPIALARIKANLTQEELAQRLKVSQAYVCRLEKQLTVSAKTLQKVMSVLDDSQGRQ